MARWAVFDVDGTLLPHTSTEQLFIKELFTRQVFTPAQWLTFLLLALNGFRYGLGSALRANKGYYRGMPVGTARQFAGWFFRHHLKARLSPIGLAEVSRRQQQGYRIFILSGAPQFLIEPLAAHLQADYVLGSRLEHHNGRFTGRLAAPHPYALHKRDYLKALAPELDLDFQQSAVYANHHTDALHMELFHEVVAVNPTPRLAQIAGEHHWPVVHW